MPGKYTFTVPAGVTTLTYSVLGGGAALAGGRPRYYDTVGALASGELVVSPGQELTVIVGQGNSHEYQVARGYGDGGGASRWVERNIWVGGGGAGSALVYAGNPVVVAGGGGAVANTPGDSNVVAGPGADAGRDNSDGGNASLVDRDNIGRGGGAAGAIGGWGGTTRGGVPYPANGVQGQNHNPATGGAGGYSRSNGNNYAGFSGGGGGGYAGGGSGSLGVIRAGTGAGAGGGAGSSFIDDKGVSGIVATGSVTAGNNRSDSDTAGLPGRISLSWR